MADRGEPEQRSDESNAAIYASIAANVAIAATKLTAAAFSGSSAMVAEGIHSLVDCADGGLLLLGRVRSRRPPDEQHPFGHGRELYFWTLIVAVLFFAIGGGVSGYEGVHQLMHPEPLRDPTWSYVVLGAAALFDGASFVVGYKQFRRHAAGRGMWATVRDSKDPTVFTVVLEDLADVTGLAIAFLGVWLGHRLGNPYLDGVASVGVGLVMATVAVLLIGQSRGLLIGERADPATVERIREAVQSDPGVERVRRIRTIHLAPDEIAAVLDVTFRPGLSTDGVARAARSLDTAIRREAPATQHVYFAVESLHGLDGERGDGQTG